MFFLFHYTWNLLGSRLQSLLESPVLFLCFPLQRDHNWSATHPIPMLGQLEDERRAWNKEPLIR